MAGRLTTLHRNEVHADGIWSAQWSGNNRVLTGGQDESVKHWEEKSDGSLGLLQSYDGHTLGVVSVGVHPSGQVAASSSLDSIIRVSVVRACCRSYWQRTARKEGLPSG